MDSFSQLLLNMGYVTGALSNREARDEIVATIKANGLRREYVETLHAHISEILERTMDACD